MARQRMKKVNPRRIPLAKREINEDAILEEATKNDLYEAWLLVFHAPIELELIPFEEMPVLTEMVNQYIRDSANSENRREEAKRAELLMGISCPQIHKDIDSIRSAVELEAFKRKVKKVATYTALSVLCLGLDSTGRLSNADMRKIFLHADLTLAEIEHGIVSYKGLENRLADQGMEIERESDDLHHAHICETPAE